jgi:hypothetical protein
VVFVHSGLPFPVTSPADALTADNANTNTAQTVTARIRFI